MRKSVDSELHCISLALGPGDSDFGCISLNLAFSSPL